MDNDLLVRIAFGFAGSMAIIFNKPFAEGYKWDKSTPGVTNSKNWFGRAVCCSVGLFFVVIAIIKN